VVTHYLCLLLVYILKMKQKSIKKVGNKGFTLIELLVVISIISLLSSVVLASVQVAKDRAKATAYRANVMQFINALEIYKNDNGKYPGEQILANAPGDYGYFYTTFNSIYNPNGQSLSYPYTPIYTIPSDFSSYISKLSPSNSSKYLYL
jgi:general secretion pathway protein G